MYHTYGQCGRFSARKRKAKPLRASRSLSETFPGTCYMALSLKGTTLRGNRVARIDFLTHEVHCIGTPCLTLLF